LPETSIPFEIVYSENREYLLYWNNGKVEKLPVDTNFKKYKLSVKNHKFVLLKLDKEFLKSINNLKLVDMPGFDSGLEEHDKAIYEYIPKSMAYIIVIDAETGSVKESVLQLLSNDLKVFNMPVYVIVNKADKKMPEIDSIVKLCKQQIEDALNVKDVPIGYTSARKKEIEPLKNFLLDLNSKADEIFKDIFNTKFKNLADTIIKYLNFQVKNWDKDTTELDIKEEKLKSELKELSEKLKDMESKIDTAYDETVEDIKISLKSELYNNIDRYAEILLARGNIQDDIKKLAKKVCFDKFHNNFKEKISNYLRELGEEIEHFEINIDLQDLLSIDESALKKGLNALITSALTLIGIELGGPIGAVVGAIVGFIMDWIISKGTKKIKLKQIKSKLEDEIPNITKRIAEGLEVKKFELVDKIKERIKDAIQKEKQLIEKAIEDLRNRKKEKIERSKNLKAEMEKDLEIINKLCEQGLT